MPLRVFVTDVTLEWDALAGFSIPELPGSLTHFLEAET
jgi:hypothetical protein